MQKIEGSIDGKTFDILEEENLRKLEEQVSKFIIFPDLKLVFSGEKVLYAHRYILYKDSIYFRNLFTDNKNIIELDCTFLPVFSDYDTFILYFSYLYEQPVHDEPVIWIKKD